MTEVDYTTWTPLVIFFLYVPVAVYKGYFYKLVPQITAITIMSMIAIAYHYCVHADNCPNGLTKDSADALDYFLAFATLSFTVSTAIRCCPTGLSIENNEKNTAIYIYVMIPLGVILVLVTDRFNNETLAPMIVIATINFCVLCYYFKELVVFMLKDDKNIMSNKVRFFIVLIQITISIMSMITWAILRLVRHIDSSKIDNYPWHGLGHILAGFIAGTLMSVQPSSDELYMILKYSTRGTANAAGTYDSL